MKPRLLDLFCGAGGAAMGYARAGFEIVGVDINPQPHYPFEFHQGDALSILAAGARTDVWPWESGMPRWAAFRFEAIHASPPCQMFSSYRRSRPNRGDEHYVNLIPQTRKLLASSGIPYVIENVYRAPLHAALKLCGSMFDPPLDVERHRYFETSELIMAPAACRHGVWPPDRYPGGRSKERTGTSRGLVRATVEVGSWDIPLEDQRAAMGIDWMEVPELSQAVPPAYTEWIGRQLLAVIKRAAA